eukprot:14743-Heterococcus_DN1.PRE.6
MQRACKSARTSDSNTPGGSQGGGARRENNASPRTPGNGGSSSGPSAPAAPSTCCVVGCTNAVRSYTVLVGNEGADEVRQAPVCATHWNEAHMRQGIPSVEARPKLDRAVKLVLWLGKGGSTKSTTQMLMAWSMAVERKMKVLSVDLDDQNDLAGMLLRKRVHDWAGTLGDDATFDEEGQFWYRTTEGYDRPITHHDYMARPVTVEEQERWGRGDTYGLHHPRVKSFGGKRTVRSIQESFEAFTDTGDAELLPVVPEQIEVREIMQHLHNRSAGRKLAGLEPDNLGTIHLLYAGDQFDRIKHKVNTAEDVGGIAHRWQGAVQYLIDHVAEELASDVVLVDMNPDKGILQRNITLWADYLVLTSKGGCRSNVDQMTRTLERLYRNYDTTVQMSLDDLKVKGSWLQQYLFQIQPTVNDRYGLIFPLPTTCPKVLGYITSNIEVTPYADSTPGQAGIDPDVNTWARGQGLFHDEACVALRKAAVLAHGAVQHHMDEMCNPQTAAHYKVSVQGAGLSARTANTIATRVTVLRPKVVIEHATYEHLRLSCRLGLMPACHGLEPLLQQMQWPSLFTPKNILTGERAVCSNDTVLHCAANV